MVIGIVTASINLILKVREAMSVSIIGGVILFVAGIFMIIKKKWIV